MVTVDTTTKAAVNVSTSAERGASPRSGGGMVYIPNYGKHGILVAIGGINDLSGSEYPHALASYVSMNEILIYDINGYYENYNGWYTQKASGDVPGHRVDTCVIVESLPDNSSHSIYLYDGRGPSNTTYDDVYVLSVPSYVWPNVYSGVSLRYGHSCHGLGNQLITVGGSTSTGECDWENKGVAVLDLSITSWTRVYEPSTPAYTLPALVENDITDRNGNLMQQPPSGFDSSSLAKLFNPKSHSSSVGAILGGVIGGLAVLLSSVSSCIWLRRRKRISNAAKLPSEGSSDGTQQSKEAESEPVNELDESMAVFEKSAPHQTHELVAGRGVVYEMQHEVAPQEMPAA